MRDFNEADINIINGSLSELITEDSITFALSISPVGEGEIKLHVNADAAYGLSSKGNKAAYAILTYDPTPPIVAFGNQKI